MADPDTINIGCRLEVLPGDRIIDKLTGAASFGFDTVALPGRFLNDYLDELRGCLADSPVPLSSMSLGFEGSLVSPDPDERKRCTDSLIRLFDICAELEVSVVNMPPFLICDNPVRMTDPGEFASVTERQDALLIEQLPALADAARDRSIQLVLEPVIKAESDYMNTAASAARVARAINHPNIGITVDFFHMNQEETSIPEAIRSTGDCIGMIHLAEYQKRVEPFPGSVDFIPGFRAINDMGYQGIIEIECRTLSGPGEDVLPAACRYLREQWQQA